MPSPIPGCTPTPPTPLGLDPADCLFVDDVPRHVAAAIDLGYQGCAVLRDGSQARNAHEVLTVSDLRALLPLVR